MKLSIYNHSFCKNKFYYWYNSLTHASFRTGEGLGRKLTLLLQDIESFREDFPLVYEKFTQHGFIVDNGMNELEKSIELNEQEANSPYYMLTIMPTLNCNFKCHYCFQKHIPSIMSEDTIQRICRHIDLMINEKYIKSLNIEWFGGEPFMYLEKVVKPISLYAIEKCDQAGIPFVNSATTNGYFLVPSKIDLLKELRFKRFQITLDGDREVHNKVKFQSNCKSAFDQVLNNIKNILTSMHDVRMVIRINYSKKNLTSVLLNQINEYFGDIDKKNINIVLKKIWQEYLSEDDYSEVYKIAYEFVKNGYFVDFSDMIGGYLPCYVSKKFYNCINYNGKVYKCTANDDIYDESIAGDIAEDGQIVFPNNSEEKYLKKSYNNKVCLSCKFLPSCYGQCPRDFLQSSESCKLKVGMSIETRIVNLTDFGYELLSHNI